MQAAAGRGYLGDAERAAARVVARLTGERVVIQDDNRVRGMADIRIEYSSGDIGYVEVVADVDEPYAEMTQLVFRDQTIHAPELGRVWYVTVSRDAALKVLR